MNWIELIKRDFERPEVLMKVTEWSRIRAEIKQDFDRMGIRRCEICNGSFALGFAHRLKRRHIVTDAEKRAVALLCTKCHEDLEYGGSIRMFNTITKIIENRCETLEIA